MPISPTQAVKLFGTEEPPAETRLLTAGPLSAELDAGNLRYICYEGHEAIRAISYVVRDQYWGTFNPEITNLAVAETAEGFTVTYDAVCKDPTQSFGYAARIVGSADGRLSFEGRGTATSDFLTNRTGFVVLHPVEGVSGEPVEVLHTDNRAVETVFPGIIDPKQPIMDIRALTHQVAPGLKVVCTMEGDTFEMEDQRNWTDASYKTYVRPLALPHPFTLAAGEVIEQSVTLSFETSGAVHARPVGGAVELCLGTSAGRVPDFAMGVEAQHLTAALARADSLAPLRPRFLSCFFDARRPGGAETMRDLGALGEVLGAELALEAVIPGEAVPEEELAEVAALAEAAGLRFASVAVSPAGDLEFVMPGTVFADSAAFDAVYAAARAVFPGVPLGGGSFVYFTEMNRKPPPFDQLDFVCHTTCAIVHAADDRSVAETIECLPYIIKSCRAMIGDKSYRIGPVGIGTRTSPFGADPPANPASGRVAMTREDPRVRGLLGAAWHLGYGARMAESGVDAVILGAPVGEAGLVHHPMAYKQPWYDEAGGLYPAYHVVRGLYAASGAKRRACEVSVPREIQALAYETKQGLDLWLANLRGEERTVALDGVDSGRARMTSLDEESFEACAADPDGFEAAERALDGGRVRLAPYAVARLRVPN